MLINYMNLYYLFTGLLISVPFLAATFIIFMFIPDLRDTHGKCLSCHVACLAIGYIALAVVQLTGEELSHNVCVTLGEYHVYIFTLNL